ATIDAVVLSSGSACMQIEKKDRSSKGRGRWGGAGAVVIAQQLAQRAGGELAAALGKKGGRPPPALGAQVGGHARGVGVGGGELDATTPRRPPTLLDGERRHVGGAARPVGAEREAVGDVADDVDRSRDPVSPTSRAPRRRADRRSGTRCGTASR